MQRQVTLARMLMRLVIVVCVFLTFSSSLPTTDCSEVSTPTDTVPLGSEYEQRVAVATPLRVHTEPLLQLIHFAKYSGTQQKALSRETRPTRQSPEVTNSFPCRCAFAFGPFSLGETIRTVGVASLAWAVFLLGVWVSAVIISIGLTDSQCLDGKHSRFDFVYLDHPKHKILKTSHKIQGQHTELTEAYRIDSYDVCINKLESCNGEASKLHPNGRERGSSAVIQSAVDRNRLICSTSVFKRVASSFRRRFSVLGAFYYRIMRNGNIRLKIQRLMRTEVVGRHSSATLALTAFHNILFGLFSLFGAILTHGASENVEPCIEFCMVSRTNVCEFLGRKLNVSAYMLWILCFEVVYDLFDVVIMLCFTIMEYDVLFHHILSSSCVLLSAIVGFSDLYLLFHLYAAFQISGSILASGRVILRTPFGKRNAQVLWRGIFVSVLVGRVVVAGADILKITFRVLSQNDSVVPFGSSSLYSASTFRSSAVLCCYGLMCLNWLHLYFIWLRVKTPSRHWN